MALIDHLMNMQNASIDFPIGAEAAPNNTMFRHLTSIAVLTWIVFIIMITFFHLDEAGIHTKGFAEIPKRSGKGQGGTTGWESRVGKGSGRCEYVTRPQEAGRAAGAAEVAQGIRQEQAFGVLSFFHSLTLRSLPRVLLSPPGSKEVITNGTLFGIQKCRLPKP